MTEWIRKTKSDSCITSERQVPDLMTGNDDVLSVHSPDGVNWEGEYNSPEFADPIDIDEHHKENSDEDIPFVCDAKTIDEAEAAADAWLKSYTG